MKNSFKILTFNLSDTVPVYVFQDTIEAFNHLGHIVNLVNLRPPGTSPEEKLNGLCGELVRFRPDFVFVINEEITLLPKLPTILTEMEIPYAVWSIDNPFYWVTKESLSPYCSIFVRDKVYVKDLKRFGFDHVFLLPLAVNPRNFRESDLISSNERSKYSCNISFFGLSLYRIYCQAYNMEVKDPISQTIINETIEVLSKNPLLSIWDILEQVQDLHHASLIFDESETKRLMMLIEYAATSLYRKEIIEEIYDLGLHLYGDDGWRDLVNGRVEFCGMLNYKELLKLYNASRINLSIPMVQLKTGVDQEVYDISACGSFALVNYRPGIEDLFELGKEVVCYHNKDELKELCHYFLKHPGERRQIGRCAQSRVLREHTYEERMNDLVNVVTQRFFG